MRRFFFNVFSIFLLLEGLTSCRKVPLTADGGGLDFAAAHWFESENVAYVFFSLAEDVRRLVNPAWSMRILRQSQGGGIEDLGWEHINLQKGVHSHELVACGENRTCGSYSFKSTRPIGQIELKFFYDADSPLSVTHELSVNNHQDDSSIDAHSALFYGVFDRENEYVQVRYENNFGSPSDGEVASFGLKRKFLISEPALAKTSVADLNAFRESSNPLLFPARFCDDHADPQYSMTEKQMWLSQVLSRDVPDLGACAAVGFLDQEGKPLIKEAVPFFSQRNPELRRGEMTLKTPLREVLQIPISIRICADDPSASLMIDNDFYIYQSSILGMPDRSPDICFRLGKESKFQKEIEILLVSRLAEARATVVDSSQDLMFVILLHESFGAEFTSIQQKLTASLTQLGLNERALKSPRLVGSMVYAGSVDYSPNALQKKYVTWCPQKLLPNLVDPDFPMADENCTVTPSVDIDLEVINFVAPMGPFPSLQKYQEYVDEFGDKGLARSPELIFYSVPVGVNTQVDSANNVTYFDRFRYPILEGEKAALCLQSNDGFSASDFFIKPSDWPLSTGGLSGREINGIWLSEDSGGEYLIGLSWDLPYWGGVSYKSALTGTVIGVVPFQQSFNAFEKLGDAKWQTHSWPFGKNVTHCKSYCDHPYFDNAGTYQVGRAWSSNAQYDCPNPKIPVRGT